LRKTRFLNRFLNKCTTYNQIILFTIDNIPTGHLQLLRSQLRNDKTSLMFGKNTLIKRALKNLSVQYDPNLAKLIPYFKSNVGCLFAHDSDVLQLMYFIEQNGVTANAKPGMIAPCNVNFPKGTPTSLSPEKTSFFQAAGINTKISGGKIEIIKDVALVKEGEVVSETAYRILELLKLKPFKYYMRVQAVYDQGELTDLHLIRQAEKMMKKGVEHISILDRFLSSTCMTQHDGDDNDMDVDVDFDPTDPGEERLFSLFGDEEDEEPDFRFSGDSSLKNKENEDNEDGDDNELLKGMFGED